MKGIFITGTDTGVGKTICSGLLAGYLTQRGYRVITQKWVQTGSCSDIAAHLKLIPGPQDEIKAYSSYVCAYSFNFASSPHLAASLEKRTIKPEKIKQSFKFLSQRFDFVVVEGSGGALVPYSRKKLLIDIVSELDLPVVIVVANKLGAINHSLLTIEAIKKRNINIAGVIFNNQQKKINKLILDENVRIIKDLTGTRVLGALPWAKDKKHLARAFMPIGKNILTRLKQAGDNG
ncbi:dethiobiotin synthase [Candidatus Omnitrophota bacterium]